MRDSIKVIRYGPIYVASVDVSVQTGSPHRAFGMHGVAIARGFGLSDKKAAERCDRRRRSILESDAKHAKDVASRTTYFNGERRS